MPLWKQYILGALLLCLGTSAAAAEKRPDWIDGTSSFYSEEEYLTGVGSGGSRREAEDAAYTALARIFRAQVQSQTQEREHLRQGEAQGKIRTERTVDLSQSIEVSTQKVLENVRISEHWVEPETRVHYALATVFRRQAAAALAERIGGLDRQIAVSLAEAEASDKPLQRLRALRRTDRLMQLRQAYNTDLRIMRRSGEGIEPSVTPAALAALIDAFLSRDFRLSVETSGPEGKTLRPTLMEGLTREGFQITDSKEDTDLVVSAEGSTEKVDLQDPRLTFVRWEVHLDLVEGPSGRILGSVGRTGREAHLTPKEAHGRARRAMQRTVAGSLLNELLKVLDGPEE